MVLPTLFAVGPLFAAGFESLSSGMIILVVIVLLLVLLIEGMGMRYIPNNRVGISEKLWSAKGSVPEGRIIALNDEAGYQARPQPGVAQRIGHSAQQGW